MEFKMISKLEEGNYITRYNLHYETADGKNKIYEMISRNPDMKTSEDVKNDGIDAVVLIMEDETHEHILISKEFRLAANSWVYNFPAGMIDPGEEPDESARRELKEETGLDLISITDHIGPSYSAIGFSNEKNYSDCRKRAWPNHGHPLTWPFSETLCTNYFSSPGTMASTGH